MPIILDEPASGPIFEERAGLAAVAPAGGADHRGRRYLSVPPSITRALRWAAARPSCLWYVFGIALLISGLLVTVRTVGMVIDSHSPSLQGDEWSVLARYVAMRDGRLSPLGFLWEQHNEHRVTLARIFFLADILVDLGTQVLTKTVTLLFCAAAAGFFSLLVIRLDRLHRGIRLGAVGLLVALFMSSHQLENLYRGFNSQVLTVTFFAVLALYLTSRSIEDGRTPMLWSALASGILATYSMSNGIAVWPLMLLLCFVLRAGRRATVTVAIVGTLAIVSFLSNYHSPDNHPSLLAGLSDPLGFATYFLAFLAGPYSGFNLRRALVLGGVALLLLLYHLLRQRGADRYVPRLAWFLIATCLLVMAFDLMVTLGRFGFGVEQGLSSRYSSYVAPLYAALLLLGLSRINEAQQSPMRKLDQAVLGLTALICAIGLLPNQSRPIVDWRNGQFDMYQRLAAVAITGAPDDVFLATIANPQLIERGFPYLAEHRLSMFSRDSSPRLRHAIGEKAELLSMINPAGKWCIGFIDQITPMTPGSDWLRVSGWVANQAAERTPEGIAFADRGGQVVGAAQFASIPPDGAFHLKPTGLPVLFVGYAKATELIRGYAYREGDGCLFAERPVP